MGPPLYMRSVVDRNIVMRCMTVHIKFAYVAVSCITQPSRPHTALDLDTSDVDCHTTQTTHCHIPEGHDLHLQHCDKCKTSCGDYQFLLPDKNVAVFFAVQDQLVYPSDKQS